MPCVSRRSPNAGCRPRPPASPRSCPRLWPVSLPQKTCVPPARNTHHFPEVGISSGLLDAEVVISSTQNDTFLQQLLFRLRKTPTCARRPVARAAPWPWLVTALCHGCGWPGAVPVPATLKHSVSPTRNDIFLNNLSFRLRESPTFGRAEQDQNPHAQKCVRKTSSFFVLFFARLGHATCDGLAASPPAPTNAEKVRKHSVSDYILQEK